jgi:hypothetical protein
VCVGFDDAHPDFCKMIGYCPLGHGQVGDQSATLLLLVRGTQGFVTDGLILPNPAHRLNRTTKLALYHNVQGLV